MLILFEVDYLTLLPAKLSLQGVFPWNNSLAYITFPVQDTVPLTVVANNVNHPS